MIVAIGMLPVTRTAGRTLRTDGAMPKLHCSTAPPNTAYPIYFPSSSSAGSRGGWTDASESGIFL